MSVAWRANTEPDLAGYYIYYGPQSRVYTNRVRADRTATTARIEPLVPNGTYYLAITAVNLANIESFPSAELIYRAPPGSNSPPTISAIADQVIQEDVPSQSIAFSISDPDNAVTALTVTARSSNPRLVPDNYVLLGGSGTERNLLIVPQLEQSGSAQITVEVRDPFGASSSVSFNVVVATVNDDPVISPIANQTINEDAANTRLSFYVFDAESPPNELWVLALSSEQWLIPDENITISGTGNSRTLSFTPAKDASGSCFIDLYVVDPEDGFSMIEFNVTVRPVNDAPMVSPIANMLLDEDSSSPIVQLNVVDVDSPLASVRLSASSSNPSLIGTNGFVFGGVEGKRTMVITPRPNQFGVCLVRLVATDAAGASSTNGFIVSVRPMNDPPNLDPIPSFSVNEGWGPLSVPLTGIHSGATNEPDALTITAVSSRPEIVAIPQISYTSPNSFGSLSLAALPNTNGTVLITVSVSDGAATSTRSFTVSVQAINDPPTIYSLPEVAVLRLPAPLQITFSVQDPDTPQDRLVVTGYSSDLTLLPANNLVFTGTGTQRTLTIIPVLGRTGVATVTIVVSDGDTAVSASFSLLVSGLSS